ncbi:MAG: hypothetical protein ABFS37_07215 [Acidobacteriota bacterium]
MMDIRQHPETAAATIPIAAVETALPTRRAHWPAEAQEAFSGVLRDLNAWCRDNDSPVTLNGLMAEEAIRRTWGEASATV